MNDKYDFSSKKYIILLILICILFVIIVVKAFEYLPEEKAGYEKNTLTAVNSQHYNTPDFTQEDVYKNNSEEVKQKKTLNISLPKHYDRVDLDDIESNPKMIEIDMPPTELGTPEQTPPKTVSRGDDIDAALKTARDYKNSAKYIEALDEYKNILAYASDKNTIAQVYQEIAEIYAASKRYGTALSYATKSYNMRPTSYRELLLARLYYKTGDIDRATTRVNNILRRDFAEDR